MPSQTSLTGDDWQEKGTVVADEDTVPSVAWSVHRSAEDTITYRADPSIDGVRVHVSVQRVEPHDGWDAVVYMTLENGESDERIATRLYGSTEASDSHWDDRDTAVTDTVALLNNVTSVGMLRQFATGVATQWFCIDSRSMSAITAYLTNPMTHLPTPNEESD